MHNMYANFAKVPGAHKHYAQEFVNERANEQTGTIIKTLPFFHFTLKIHDYSGKKLIFASSIFHITI